MKNRCLTLLFTALTISFCSVSFAKNSIPAIPTIPSKPTSCPAHCIARLNPINHRHGLRCDCKNLRRDCKAPFMENFRKHTCDLGK